MIHIQYLMTPNKHRGRDLTVSFFWYSLSNISSIITSSFSLSDFPPLCSMLICYVMHKLYIFIKCCGVAFVVLPFASLGIDVVIIIKLIMYISCFLHFKTFFWVNELMYVCILVFHFLFQVHFNQPSFIWCSRQSITVFMMSLSLMGTFW